MKVNTKIRYGLRAMIEIANNPEGILQKDISINQAISPKYLDQIIAGLKTSGLIVRLAGKSSGYRLNKSVEEISVYDIYRAFEYKLVINDCPENNEFCPFKTDCKSKNYWCDLNREIINHMENKKLSDIINEL